jgi:hypothetical protein
MNRTHPPPELTRLLARLRRGELIAAVAFAIALLAGIAWTRGMSGGIIAVAMAVSAATSVLAAWIIIPTVIKIRKLGERKRRGKR